MLQMLGGPAGVLAQKLGKLAELEVLELEEVLDKAMSAGVVRGTSAADLQPRVLRGGLSERPLSNSSVTEAPEGGDRAGVGEVRSNCMQSGQRVVGTDVRGGGRVVGNELLQLWSGKEGGGHQLEGRGAVAVPVMLLHVDELMRVWSVISKYAEARQQQAHLLLELMQKADLAEQQLQLQNILARWVSLKSIYVL
jgi:hypothetical protein